MKFGKSLSNHIEETLPEWRDKFLSYKDLKKRLKLVEPNGGDRPAKRSKSFDAGDCVPAGDGDGVSGSGIDFVKLLETELEKFNTFFVEKEEEYIIRLKELQDRVAEAEQSTADFMKSKKQIVDLHGEMVLLENYSALNYTGLVKILKKYDKRTGALIRTSFVQKVLRQPFFTTDLLYKLVKECETMVDCLFPVKEAPASTEATDKDEGCSPAASSSNNDGLQWVSKKLTEIEHMESLHMKSTILALRALKEIRSGSSTVSVFSLPPLQITGLEEIWKKVPLALEQVAK